MFKITKLDKYTERERLKLFVNILEGEYELKDLNYINKFKIKSVIFPETYIEIDNKGLKVYRKEKIVYELNENTSTINLISKAIMQRPLLTGIILDNDLGFNL